MYLRIAKFDAFPSLLWHETDIKYWQTSPTDTIENMEDSFGFLCTSAIESIHDLTPSGRINIQEIPASQGYFLNHGAPLVGPFNVLDNIDSCVAITSMQFAMICVGLFNIHNAINVINGWVSPVIRQLRPNPSVYSHTDAVRVVSLLKQWLVIPAEVKLGDPCRSCIHRINSILHLWCN